MQTFLVSYAGESDGFIDGWTKERSRLRDSNVAKTKEIKKREGMVSVVQAVFPKGAAPLTEWSDLGKRLGLDSIEDYSIPEGNVPFTKASSLIEAMDTLDFKAFENNGRVFHALCGYGQSMANEL